MGVYFVKIGKKELVVTAKDSKEAKEKGARKYINEILKDHRFFTPTDVLRHYKVKVRKS